MTGAPRCLVVVRAGDASLHPTWTDDLPTRTGAQIKADLEGITPSTAEARD